MTMKLVPAPKTAEIKTGCVLGSTSRVQ